MSYNDENKTMFAAQHLLVAIDPNEDYGHLLTKTAALAKATNSRVTLFSRVFHSGLTTRLLGDETANRAKDFAIEQAQAYLEKLAETLREQGIKTATHVAWDKHLVSALEHYRHDDSFDVLLKATHYQNVIQRTFLSHTDWELIRHMPVPLLLTKAEDWDGEPAIAVCVDPVDDEDPKISGRDDEIITKAKAFVKHVGGNIAVIHAFDPGPIMVHAEQPAMDHTAVLEEVRQAHEQRMEELCDRHDIDDIILEMGPPAQVIPEAVYTNDYQIVMLGAHSRNGFERMLIGHTAERILDRITADILVIPDRN